MNILYVSDSTTVSGAEIVMLGYLDGLASRGHTALGFVSHRNPRLIAAFEERVVPCTTTSRYSPHIIQPTVNPAALLSYGRSCVGVTRESGGRAAWIDYSRDFLSPHSMSFVWREPSNRVWAQHPAPYPSIG